MYFARNQAANNRILAKVKRVEEEASWTFFFLTRQMLSHMDGVVDTTS